MPPSCAAGRDKIKKILISMSGTSSLIFQQHDQHLLGPAARQQAITTQRMISAQGIPNPRLNPNLQPKPHGPLESESSAVRRIAVVTGIKLVDVDIPV